MTLASPDPERLSAAFEVAPQPVAIALREPAEHAPLHQCAPGPGVGERLPACVAEVEGEDATVGRVGSPLDQPALDVR